MTTFLGPVGSLIPVKCASQLTATGGRQVSFENTLGKRKAFLGRVRARQWQVDIGLAKPSELSGLRWLAENVNAPMVWYSPDAVVGNILPPQQGGLAPGTYNGFEGALVRVDEDIYVKSAHSDGQFVRPVRPDGGIFRVPVVEGEPLTVSSWMAGATLSGRQMIRVVWLGTDGLDMGSTDTDFEMSEVFSRRSVTLTPPVGATQIGLQFYARQVAGPAVTLTDRLMPYSPGKGATNVLAHGLSDAVIKATESQQLQSLSFTISEVG